ncbi:MULTISPECIES: NAD(P)-dependent oxidoreductase [unclassified Bradyrhizobium]|jgi:3-hydroxyisobutyrate dehydrogenase|uniref:NAD(P)-dependent oxidoreductase n=1 Tax=unclassified Bradyrhizobium TaxID=2631580 RepID=UPI0004638FE9|nr:MULTISPECIES: NAD(P)-dependent oxidoreductase [unclassified Bradyrhizobium]AUC98371.1 NAD(P)-dependent oxidoreductase [Bradyrhizobium sp. SK17]OCX32649.1 3-hydroxyisobutyrate dehydrogenase [Bradyrhizobium sp. UASWS1016]
MNTIGVIGLGNIGQGMALSLRRAGFEVIGTALSAATRERASLELGIRVAPTVSAVCAEADAIVLSLPTPADVASVIEGPGGILDSARSGMLVIDTSTSTPETTRRLASLLDAVTVRMMDAPVSGGPARARDGTLTMMIGCNEDAWERAGPVLRAMSARQIRVGDIGAGHVAKIANNLLLSSHLAIAGEVMHMTRSAGVSIERVLDAINAGTGRSMVTEHNFKTWILNDTFNSGFTMGLMRKDVQLSAALISALELSLPISGSVARCWANSVERYPDNEDFNRIVEMPDGDKRGNIP